jgi:hypothetical protein
MVSLSISKPFLPIALWSIVLKGKGECNKNLSINDKLSIDLYHNPGTTEVLHGGLLSGASFLRRGGRQGSDLWKRL